jgi:hypothetical protein
MDADGEICIPKNFDSGDGAKEYAQYRLPSFATGERDSRKRTLAAKTESEKADEEPLTLILSPQAGRGRPLQAATRESLKFQIPNPQIPGNLDSLLGICCRRQCYGENHHASLDPADFLRR